MMTAEQIAEMDNDQARQFTDAVGSRLYNTTSWRARFARDAGIHYQTIAAWFKEDGRPRTWAIMLLQSWQALNQADQALQGVQKALQHAPGDISAPLGAR